MPPRTAEGVLGQDELAVVLAQAAGFSPFVAGRCPRFLDTEFVRTGPLSAEERPPPRPVRIARDGVLRLFMEYGTLAETGARLPRFTGQLGVPAAELRRALNKDWLPHIEVVRLPHAEGTATPTRKARRRQLGTADI